MADPKEIRDHIIEMLETGKPKNSANKTIGKWLKARPSIVNIPEYPYGWVECALGPEEPTVLTTLSKVTDNFYIVVVDHHVDSEIAEDSVLEFEKTVKAVLKTDPTIGGLVQRSHVSNREKYAGFERDYSVHAVRLTLFTTRKE